MQNENLIPELIVDLAKRYNNSKNPNEKIALEFRLSDIRNYIDSCLKNNKIFRVKKWKEKVSLKLMIDVMDG